MTYLSSLPVLLRSERLRALGHVPAIVMSRGRLLPDYARRTFEELRVPVIRTHLVTGHFMNAGTVLLQNPPAPASACPVPWSKSTASACCWKANRASARAKSPWR